MTPLPKPARRAPRQPKALRRSPVRRGRPRRQRKSTPAQLKRRLWTLVSAWVKAEHGNRCYTCGAAGLEGSNWHTCHFINAGKSMAVRYDPDNLRPGCMRCNIGLRGNIAEFAVRLLDEIGEAKFRALIQRSRLHKHWTRPELESLIAVLEAGGDYEAAYAELAVPPLRADTGDKPNA